MKVHQTNAPSKALLKRAVNLVKNGKSKRSVLQELNIKGYSLNRALKEAGVESKFDWRPEDEKKRAIELYEKGIVPKEMHKHGITASWPAIYKWVKAAGCETIRFNTRGRLRQELINSDFDEDRWKAYSKLVRRLSHDTYRDHKDEIDPDRMRGTDWHLDHKTSIYSAFLKGWSPEKASHRRNLQMLPAKENRQKYTF